MDPASGSTLLPTILTTLRTLTPLDRIWNHGLVHPGGPHYRLRGTAGPASIGEDECGVLAQLIARFEPAHCFIIGNGFGLSSVWIAKLMEVAGGQSVATLDNRSEGDGARCFAVAAHLADRLACRLLHNAYGESPRDLPAHLGPHPYDLIFIDGNHAHPHALHDFLAALPALSPTGILCWHDYWLPGVAASVDEAQRHGLHCLLLETSCEMVFGTRSPAVHRALQQMFPHATLPTRRRHPWARLRLTGSFLTAQFRKYVS